MGINNKVADALSRREHGQNAELAAIIALKYWIDKQKEIKPVETIPTNWTNRLIDK